MAEHEPPRDQQSGAGGTQRSPSEHRPGTAWRRLQHFWRVFAGFALSATAVTAFVALVGVLVQDLAENSIRIEPLSVPKALQDDGYTPVVTAQKLADAIVDIATRARTTMKQKPVALPATRPDITVPSVGISVEQIADVILRFLHSGRQQRVAGEVTTIGGVLRLELRLNDEPIYRSPADGSSGGLDGLIEAGARAVMHHTEPYFLAAADSDTSPSKAIAETDDIIARLPSDDVNVLRSYALRGKIFSDLGKHFYARQNYAVARAIDPTFAFTYTGLGTLESLENHPKAAVFEYYVATELEPYNAQFHADLAFMLEAAGRHKDANDELEEAVRLSPADPTVHATGTLLYLLANNTKRAAAEARKCIRLDTTVALCHDLLGRSLDQNGTESLAEFRTAVRLAPTSAMYREDLAATSFRQNKIDLAIDQYRAASRLLPNASASADHYTAAMLIARKVKSGTRPDKAMKLLSTGCEEFRAGAKLDRARRMTAPQRNTAAIVLLLTIEVLVAADANDRKILRAHGCPLR